MNEEFDHMLTVFKSHFFPFRLNNIAIYGVGNYANALDLYCPEYHFCAFIDREPDEKRVGEHKAVPLDSIKRENVDLIIAACAFKNERIIYERIIGYCDREHIPVYSIRGYLLKDFYQSIASEYRESKEELYQEINKHDCISFDFFDTLFTRRVLYPMDVFDIVARKAKNEDLEIDDFAAARIGAEYSLDNPTFDQIYDRVQEVTGITESERNLLMGLELKTEAEVLIPREDITEAYCYALKNHPVAIISDMYLPEAFFKDILKKYHLPFPNAIYVSGWRNTSKHGTLFDKYRNDFQGKSFLHIGDNPSADGSMAFSAAIDPFLIRSGIQEYREAGFASILQLCETINDRCLIGISVSSIFNSPFVYKEGTAKISSIANISWAFVAPLLAGFIIWMKDTVDTIDADVILFASRDGYLIKRLYELYLSITRKTEEKQLVYFYTSRLAALLAFIDDETDIDFCRKNIFWFNEKTIQNLLHCSSEKELLRHARTTRENYFSYLKKEKVYSKKCLLFDLSSRGRTQYFLGKIIPKLEGVYFARQMSNLPVYNKITYFFDSRCAESNVFLGDFFLESIITSTEPSVTGFDKAGIPIFSNRNRTDRECEYIRSAQEAILNYCRLFFSLYYDDNRYAISRKVLYMQYHLFRKGTSICINKDVFEGVTVSECILSIANP